MAAAVSSESGIKGICSVCEKEGSQVRCKRMCTKVVYCSEAHRLQHWPDHRQVCDRTHRRTSTDLKACSLVATQFSTEA